MIGLAIAIPVGILALAVTMGVLGTLVGLALFALRLACIGFVGYGLYRVIKFFVAPAPTAPAPRIHELPQADPYYTAAMRELDSELGPSTR
jgi:hypothetical protein